MLESELQRAIFVWRDTIVKDYPVLEWLHAIPNGGYRSAREAQGLKQQGVKAGVLDLHLPVARCGYHGMMIEIKRPGGKCKPPSKEQSQYIAFLIDQGYYCLVSNDFDEVKRSILEYLNS